MCPNFISLERLGKTASYRNRQATFAKTSLQSSFSESVASCSSHSTNKENEEAATCPVTTVNISQEECIVQQEAKVEALQKETNF